MSANTASNSYIVHCSSAFSKFTETLNYASCEPNYLPLKSTHAKILYTDSEFERFATCREAAIGGMRKILADKKEQERQQFNGFDRLHYLIGYSKNRANYMERCCTVGLKLARGFDRMIGCRPTHVFPVSTIHSNMTGRDNVLKTTLISYIEADRKWAKAPALTSLHMLLIRLGIEEALNPVLKTSLESIPNKIIELAEKELRKCRRDDYNEEDLYRVLIYGPIWIKILKDYDKHFGKKKFSTTFELQSSTAPEGGLYEDGIDCMCEDMTRIDLFDESERLRMKYEDEAECDDY
jgi:hypothetical protein